MLSNFSRQPERTILNAMAFFGAIAIFVGLLVDSLALRDIGSIFIGVAVLLWGLAHLAGREWTQRTAFGRGGIWPVLFILMGLLILGIVVAGRLGE